MFSIFRQLIFLINYGFVRSKQIRSSTGPIRQTLTDGESLGVAKVKVLCYLDSYKKSVFGTSRPLGQS